MVTVDTALGSYRQQRVYAGSQGRETAPGSSFDPGEFSQESLLLWDMLQNEYPPSQMSQAFSKLLLLCGLQTLFVVFFLRVGTQLSTAPWTLPE